MNETVKTQFANLGDPARMVIALGWVIVLCVLARPFVENLGIGKLTNFFAIAHLPTF